MKSLKKTYPQNLSEKLGFNRIIKLVQENCRSINGNTLAGEMLFQNDKKLILKQLHQCQEFKTLIELDQKFPDEPIPDVISFIHKANIEGSFLDVSEFFKILQVLNLINKTKKYFDKRAEKYPELFALFDGNASNIHLIKSIEKIIDKKGEIKSNASRELQNIQSDLIKYESQTRKKINSIYKKAKDQDWTADTEITVRDGRLVIPILAEHKRKVKGFIHDESATGQTVYIEPAEVLELNNEVRNLQLAYKRELRRILIALTNEIRPEIEFIVGFNELLGKIDFIRAKAEFAIRVGGNLPKISEKRKIIHLQNAIHPLLKLHHQALDKTVIPLNILLDEEARILVVSGPNAGGKSIALKTVGLLQLMFQAGLLVSCSPDSEMSFFNNLFVDIGDEQSIENDLSTYSSHLTNMKFFVENADAKTLFLIDEFGTGTDPHFGGPIAEAILEKINLSKAFGLINTHYSNLKLFASETSGISNGAMGFDADTLNPLYTLEIGNPGSSFAFEIADKIGLDFDVLQNAKEKIGGKQQDVDALLVNLERDKNKIEQQKQIFKMRDDLLQELIEKNKKMEAELKASKNEILHKAKLEAKALLARTNQIIEKTIREIKEKKAEDKSTQKVRKEFNKFKSVVEKKQTIAPEKEKVENFESQYKVLKNAEIKIGTEVRLKQTKSVGKVLEIKKQNAILAIGEMKISAKISNLEVVEENEKKPKKQLQSAGTGNYLETSILDFSPKIDLRGKRKDEAMNELEQYIDKAIVINFHKLSILHGKGDGILRKFIRQYLDKHPQVESYENEHADLGGDGITNVVLK